MCCAFFVPKVEICVQKNFLMNAQLADFLLFQIAKRDKCKGRSFLPCYHNLNTASVHSTSLLSKHSFLYCESWLAITCVPILSVWPIPNREHHWHSWGAVATDRPGVGVTKAPFVNFSASRIFDLAKVPVRLFASHSYLTGVTAAELRQHLSDMNVIYNS